MDPLKHIAHRAMLEHGLLPEFSTEALRQADSIARNGAKAGTAVRDLRTLLWCSIDNEDSRDLDQLTVAEPLGNSCVKLRVAIADVDALVKRGTPIDEHAGCNTTSVYTAAKIFPMLPETLSTDLTSLNAQQERLAVVVQMSIDTQGTIVAFEVYRAWVFNHAKLAYDSVAAWLDGAAPAPAQVVAVAGLDQQLRLQDQIAQKLREVRRAQGALNLETLTSRPVFNDGALADLRVDEKNRAKELIEDFMTAANGVVARFLQDQGRTALRRVLHTPKRWERLIALAAEQGELLPQEPDPRALNAFLAARREADPTGFVELSLAVVKLLGSGEYAVALPSERVDGHFGLAVHEYTHATAPNRRFADLITQRLLKAALRDAPAAYTDDELRNLATHCTQQERNAQKVERQVRKAASAQLLSSRIGQHFDAIVTGASGKGTWVRIVQPSVEGKVVKGYEGLDVGDRVRVELVSVDAQRGFIDFARSG